MQEFDPKKPYSEIHGDSMAAFYQGGEYFRSDRTHCDAEEAGKPSGSGSFANQVAAGVAEEQAKINAKKPLTLIDETNPSTNSTADIEAARKRAKARKAAPKAAEPEPTLAEIDPKSAQRAVLLDMEMGQLRQLVSDAGLTPKKGRGSRQANIKLLMENTE